MKLFLSSIAITDTQSLALTRLVGKSAGDIKLALIENAADPYPEDSRAWADDNRTAIQSHSYNVELVDLRQFEGKAAALETVLSDKDVIWVGGGNTYYLRWILKSTEADRIITEQVRQGTVYGGGSAGAIVAGPTIKFFEPADEPEEAPELILDGLGLTDTVVVPHSDSAKYSGLMAKINSNLKAAGYKTQPLKDSQVWVVNGDEQKII